MIFRKARLLLMVCSTWSLSAQAQDLTLAQVLSSTLEQNPKLTAVDAKVEQAQAARLEARGAYDLRVKADGSLAPVGTYERAYGSLALSQPTTAWGLAFFAKYENGADFPVYDGQLVTSEAGKITLGAVLPLLRGGPVDAGRFELARTRLLEEVAEQTRREERAEVLAKAASAWWKWVVTGRKLEVYRRLVGQAEERRDFLESQAVSGAVPRVEVVDNERLLSARRAALSVLELEFRQACLALGMFRRDAQGNPLPATADELPALLHGAVSMQAKHRALVEEVSRAPGIVVYDLAGKILAEQLRVARNERLPSLQLELSAAAATGEQRPYGSTTSLSEETLLGRLTFGWEVQQREARGKVAAVSAKRRELENERRLLSDRLRLGVEAQLMALTAQREAAMWNRAATRQAEEVGAAERLAFESGQSSMLTVNLREQAVLTAYIDELQALLGYHLAWVELQRILGRDSPDVYAPPVDASEAG